MLVCTGVSTNYSEVSILFSTIKLRFFKTHQASMEGNDFIALIQDQRNAEPYIDVIKAARG